MEQIVHELMWSLPLRFSGSNWANSFEQPSLTPEVALLWAGDWSRELLSSFPAQVALQPDLRQSLEPKRNLFFRIGLYVNPLASSVCQLPVCKMEVMPTCLPQWCFKMPKKLITLKGSQLQNVLVLAVVLTAGSLYASANYGNICHIFLVNICLPAVVVVSVGFLTEGKQT